MTATSTALKEIFEAGRPLVQQWLEVATQIAALRDVATEKGLDWSQVKALLKAQVQDDMDGTGEAKRVRRIVERAEFASSYADMLGLANMNEEKFSAPPCKAPSVRVPAPVPLVSPAGAEKEGGDPASPPPSDTDLDIPDFLRRSKQTVAA